MRRAAVSVMSNIAEGRLRCSKTDKLRYLENSEGSLLELDSEAEVAFAVGYWEEAQQKEFDAQKSRVGYLRNSSQFLNEFSSEHSEDSDYQ